MSHQRPVTTARHSFGFFLRESLRAMRRNASPTFAALATVTVTLIVVGVFIPIVQATRGAADSVSNRVLVEVYMKSHATRAQNLRALTQLKAIPHVQKVVFESKAQALKQQSKSDPLAFELITATRCPTPSTSTPTARPTC